MGFRSDFTACGLPELIEYIGEEVVFTPRNGTARTINAIVDLKPAGRKDGAGRMTVPKLTVKVLANGTTGILASEAAGGTLAVTMRGSTQTLLIGHDAISELPGGGVLLTFD